MAFENYRLKKIDYIIVGFGLAGASVAAQLLLREKKIVVYDSPENNVSSRVAAGLFNPMTGMKMIKTWQADTLFTYLHSFYPSLEMVLAAKFFYPLPLYRPFFSYAEQNDWLAESIDPRLEPYISETYTAPRHSTMLRNPYGGIVLAKSGYVNTSNYLAAIRHWITGNAYRGHSLDERQLIVNEATVQYEDVEARGIIFCQGEGSIHNRFFNWIPVIPLKGETLTIKTSFMENSLVNRGVYMVPDGSDTWRVGSTYQRGDFERAISEEAKIELTEKLEKVLSAPYSVVGQDYGVRPTMADRKPVLGTHPKYKTIHIFNGLGTKGISLAPYFSEVLVNAIENGGMIDKEISVNRYLSYLK